MIIRQESPEPFVVHTRTFLLLFCFTFPFTASVMRLKASLLVPLQICVSFSLLGIEFCSREMEHPFGDDRSDIPVLAIMQDVIGSVEKVEAMERRWRRRV